MALPTKVSARLTAGIKRFQPILASAKSRDVNESDTVVIVADMLQEVFGYDKYADITSEHAIRGTYCDLAIKLESALALLLEVKSIGLELKDAFVKQAVDYAANQGVDWVVLTTGMLWRVYKVTFTKPIENELVYEFNFCELNPKDDSHLELLWMLCKESWSKASLGEFHAQKQALSRFTLGAILLSESLLDIFRRELRRVSPGIKVETADIEKVLVNEVLKRDVMEGDKAEAAKRLVAKAANRALRSAGKSDQESNAGPAPADSNMETEPAPPEQL